MEIVSNEIKDWDFKTPIGISIISKQNGIGKTGLAICLYIKFVKDFFEKKFNEDIEMIDEDLKQSTMNHQLSEPKKYCEFLSAKNLDMQIRMSYNDKYGLNEQEILDSYCKKDFLVLDDIFSSSDNDFSRRNILYILDERLEWKNKATVVTSNYDFEALKKIDSRIASRMNLKNGFYEIVSEQTDIRSL